MGLLVAELNAVPVLNAAQVRTSVLAQMRPGVDLSRPLTAAQAQAAMRHKQPSYMANPKYTAYAVIGGTVIAGAAVGYAFGKTKGAFIGGIAGPLLLFAWFTGGTFRTGP